MIRVPDALHKRDDERFAMLLGRVQPSTLAKVEDGDKVVTVAGLINLAIPAITRR